MRTRTRAHEAHQGVNPGRLPVLLPGQVASPERVCDEMRREDRRGKGEADPGDEGQAAKYRHGDLFELWDASFLLLND